MFVLTKVGDLKLGDLIDLQNDPFADPTGEDPRWEFEYAVVDHIERETFNCVALYTEDDYVFGFPTEHELKVSISA